LNLTKRLYFIGIGTHGFGKILSQAAPIALLMVLSRYISIEELGFLSFIIAIFSIFSSLTELGLSNCQNKFLADDISYLSPILNWEIILALFFGSSLLLIDKSTGYFSGYGIYLFWVIVASSFSVIVSAFSGLLRLVESGIYQAIASCLFFAGSLLLFFYGHLKAVDSVLLARAGSWFLVNGWMVARLYLSGLYHWAWALPKAVWLFAFHTFWFSSVELLISQVDVILVKAILGDRLAGIFKPVSLLGVAPMVLGTLIAAPLLSILSRQTKVAPLQAWSLTRNLAAGIFVILAGAFIFIAAFSAPILAFVFTPAIAQEGNIVFLLMFASTCLYVAGMPLQEYFLAKGNSAFIGRVATVRLILFSVLVFPSLNFLGILGISIAHFFVYFVSIVIYIVAFQSIKPDAEQLR
jgi:O-antigen/teichoic acid export membrane protein